MDNPILNVFIGMGKSIRIQRVKLPLNVLFSEMPKHHTVFAALSALVLKVGLRDENRAGFTTFKVINVHCTNLAHMLI